MVRGVSERQFRRSRCGLWSLGLLVVWCPKYRRRILRGRAAAPFAELLEQVAGVHGWDLMGTQVMPDHVHVFAGVGLTDAHAQAVRAFEGRTARVPRQEFPHLRKRVGVLWSQLYFGASVGYVSESTVRRNIERQGDAVAS
jgi:REP-associated tyrosine transposase